MLECLRAGGAKMPDITDENKNALLLRYAQNGAAGGVIAVLQAGANAAHINQNQQTPLHVSAAKGSEAACRVLIEHRANMNAQDKNGDTALMLACANKQEAAAGELMEATKRAGALDRQGGQYKRSALHWASAKGLAGTVAQLLALGADATLTDEVYRYRYGNRFRYRYRYRNRYLNRSMEV